jgi:ornithine decarboxylase
LGWLRGNATYDADPVETTLFESFVPLLSGVSDVHLRAGVIGATAQATAGKPDTERAFFVANLGVELRQQLR